MFVTDCYNKVANKQQQNKSRYIVDWSMQGIVS